MKRHDSLGWVVAVLAERMRKELDTRLRKHGLTIGDWPTLFALWEEEGVTQTQLAENCQTAHYTTTRALDRLCELGLVERREHPESRRAYLVHLTAKGRELETPLTDEAKDVNEMFLGTLDADERNELMQQLRRIALE